MSLFNYGMTVDEFIDKALAEDVGDGDHTSLATIAPDSFGKATVRVKENGIIAGLSIAEKVALKVDSSINCQTMTGEGKPVKEGDVVMVLEGKTQSLLKA